MGLSGTAATSAKAVVTGYFPGLPELTRTDRDRDWLGLFFSNFKWTPENP